MINILSGKQKAALGSIPEMSRWNEFKDYKYHQRLWLQFWRKKYKGRPEDMILDFGCGPCWCGFVGRSLGYENIANLDIDNEEVRTSFKHYTDILGEEVQYWDGCAMPFETNMFKSIVAKASIMKLVGTEFEYLISELCRVTEHGGSWYIAAIDMYDRLIEALNITGKMSQLNDKEIEVWPWTWKAMEREKFLVKKMLRSIKHFLPDKDKVDTQ